MSYIDVHDMPGPQRDQLMCPESLIGAGNEDYVIWRAPFNCRIRNIVITWSATLVATGVNHFTIGVINRGTAGTGVTNLGTTTWGANYQGWVGNTLLSYAAGSYLALAAGTVLSIAITQVAAGADFPPAAVYVVYEGR